MPKPHLIQICCITILVFSTFSFCSQIEFESRESHIRVSTNQARESFEHFLATSHTVLDAQTNTTVMDCLDVYVDVINRHVSTTLINPTYVEKWVNATLVNHQACLDGFKYSNLSKVFVDLLTENKHVASNFYMSRDHGLTQLARGRARKANLVVAQDGSGDFIAIIEAIEASKSRRMEKHKFVIYVKAGIYKENIVIDRSMTDLMLIGDGIDATIITNNKNFCDGILTHNTATVQVWGAGFVAVGITFENTAGPEKQQAIALLSASNLSVFYKCSFKGYQDTLCLLEHRQFYRECDIYGTVDFIFGDASAVLQKCNIYVRNPLPGQQNTITAQGRTNSSSNTGFIIHESRVTRAPHLTLTEGSVKTFLGRPWRDYSRVVYVKCHLDTLIDHAGWLPFVGSYAFDKVYYAEYMNKGKGAATRGRVKWPGYHVLTSGTEVERFSVGKFLHGQSWITHTRVPFKSRI